jgi:AraC family transcriptional regulator
MHETQSRRIVGGLAGWQARAIRQVAAAQLAELTVASLARAVGLSPHHFSRAFRATFGMSPREWLLQQRIERATNRLLQSSDTVEQIAMSLGYRSGSQFSRMFRARIGMSPQTFRRT